MNTYKYAGSWSANNGSTYIRPVYGNNKHALAREMRQACRANVFAGSTGHWSVWEIEGNEHYDTTVLSGIIK